MHFYEWAQSRQSGRLFLQSSEMGSPTPSPAGECVPHSFGGGGGGGGGGTHSLAGEGVGESPFRRGDRHCGILGLFVLCGSGSSTVKVQTAPLLCQ